MYNGTTYYLYDLWNFPEREIGILLNYFKAKRSVSKSNERVEAIRLSYEKNLLVESEIKYIESKNFYELISMSDEQLIKMANGLGWDYTGYDHINLIKYIIDNDSQVVDSIPVNIKQKLELYQIGDKLYICGSGTFPIKEKIKMMKGKWDSKSKCWEVPLAYKNELISLMPKKITQFRSNIDLVQKIPGEIPYGLYIYQIEDKIMLCGKKTYHLKDDIKNNGGKFNGKYVCWEIPYNKIDYVIDLVNQEREKTILDIKTKEIELEINKRLDKYEPELPFISHIDRLSIEEFNKLAEKYDHDDDIYYILEEQDAEELKKLWDNKIKYIKGSSEGRRGWYTYVTYVGDYRPSDLTLIYWANKWHPLEYISHSVERVDYRIYRIYEFSTD